MQRFPNRHDRLTGENTHQHFNLSVSVTVAELIVGDFLVQLCPAIQNVWLHS